MVLERILLQTIKFDLQVEHPYQFLLKYAKQLKGNEAGGVWVTLLSVVLGMKPRTLSSIEQVLCLLSTAQLFYKALPFSTPVFSLDSTWIMFLKRGEQSSVSRVSPRPWLTQTVQQWGCECFSFMQKQVLSSCCQVIGEGK